MYLSRIQLNPKRRDAWRLLGSPQRLHAAVLQSFPAPPTGDQGGAARVLWRLDHDDHRADLYVVSPEQPDFAHLAEQAGWPTTERGATKPYAAFLERLAAGQVWAFRLAANPTRYLPHPTTGRMQRFGHVTVAQQEQWLLDKAETSGFRVTATIRRTVDGGESAIPEIAVTDRTMHRFDRRTTDPGAGRPRKDSVTLTVAQFDGRLEVTDPEALRRALVTGIGPAKAYGCGLLTLARAEQG
ncbi:type I-E CRISPR-associated protein Cas6/Cse3/CasE [Cellulomonas hominis]